MSNATKSMSKSDMEKAKVNEPKTDTTTNDASKLRAEIKEVVTKLSPVEKKEMKAKLTDAGLPTEFQKVNDPETLAKILSIVAPN